MNRVRRGDRGSVTAEMATALPVVVLLLFVGLTTVDAVITKVRCVDAAREAARAAARGESGDAAGRRSAPDGATVGVTVEGDTVRATVRVRTRPLGPHLPGFTVDADAVAATEPGGP
jgi:Flp pilus assembly protein TadG